MSEHQLYTISVDTPVGTQNGTLALLLENDQCTGRLFNEAGELKVHNGRFDNTEIHWNLQLFKPIPMTIACRAQIEGPHLKGIATVAAFGDFIFTGTRISTNANTRGEL